MAPIVGNSGRLDAPVPPMPCWAVFREAHVTCDGKLSACCFGSSSRFDMADLNETDFATGWNSAAFQALRQARLDMDVRGTACESCIARH